MYVTGLPYLLEKYHVVMFVLDVCNMGLRSNNSNKD